MRVGLLLRTAVSMLLAASGLLLVVADRQRWWPACRLGDFDSFACLTLQDHLYDFVLPIAPWVPVGDAAELAGISLLLLAVAVGMLPVLIAGPRAGWLALLLGGFMTLGVLTMAGITWFSGLAGHAVTVPGLQPAIVIFFLAWPIALIAAAFPEPSSGSEPGGRWLLVTIALLMASTPIAMVILEPILVGYSSHDTAPWSEAVVGILLVGAAITWWPASRGLPRTSQVTGGLEAERTGVSHGGR